VEALKPAGNTDVSRFLQRHLPYWVVTGALEQVHQGSVALRLRA
jgi:hypothetical protein